MSATANVGVGEDVAAGALVAVAAGGAVVTAAGAVVTAAVGAFWLGAAPHEITSTAQHVKAQRRATDDLITVVRLSAAPG